MEKIVLSINHQQKVPGIVLFRGKETLLGEECLVFAQNMLFKCLAYQDVMEAIEVISEWAIIPELSEKLVEIKFKLI